MLENITPLILTYNEAPNIERTMERLRWARDIVVVDSFSTDHTARLVAGFPQARVFEREFDNHQCQWNFGLKETGIHTEWVLALDADYVLTRELVEELGRLTPETETSGYEAKFIYCIDGRKIRGSAYPPTTVLYRRERAVYRQDGHTQRIEVKGALEKLAAPILHDDRKSLAHWLRSQDRYMELEAEKLANLSWGQLGWSDRVRKLRYVAPFVMLVYCLFARGNIFDGKDGAYYAFQRMLAETLLSLHIIKNNQTTNGKFD